jgi:hypothetical protein
MTGGRTHHSDKEQEDQVFGGIVCSMSPRLRGDSSLLSAIKDGVAMGNFHAYWNTPVPQRKRDESEHGASCVVGQFPALGGRYPCFSVALPFFSIGMRPADLRGNLAVEARGWPGQARP